MSQEHYVVRKAVSVLPRWQVVHWGDRQSSTLLFLWVGGSETLVQVDGDLAVHAGRRHPIRDGGLVQLLRAIQDEQDAQALASQPAQQARQRLLAAWQAPDPPAVAQWTFACGGFVRWLINSEVRLEAGDASHSPTMLRDVLVDLGWNPPGELHGHCWLRPADLAEAADLAVLTPMAAFGYSTPPELR